MQQETRSQTPAPGSGQTRADVELTAQTPVTAVEGRPEYIRVRKRHKKRTGWRRFTKWLQPVLSRADLVLIVAILTLAVLIGVWLGLQGR